jgi:hypothetical protein
MMSIKSGKRMLRRGVLLCTLFVILIACGAFAGNKTWTSLDLNPEDRAFQVVFNHEDPAYIYGGFYYFQVLHYDLDWLRKSRGLLDLNVQCLAMDPFDSEVLYTSGYRAGKLMTLYKSTDSGENWSKVSYLPGSPDEAVDVIVIDPMDPNYIFVGTDKRGVVWSDNGGTSWNEPSSWESGSNIVYDVAIHPADQSILYAATEEGVYKTTDRGDNWVRAGADQLSKRVRAVVIHTTNPDTVYAGQGEFLGKNHVWASPNGGSSWIQTGYEGRNGIYCMEMNPQNPLAIYIGTDGKGVYRTLNGGTSWKDINEGLEEGDDIILSMDLYSWGPGGERVCIGTNMGHVYTYTRANDVTPPDISGTTAITDTSFAGPFEVSATITDDSDIETNGTFLHYSLDKWAHQATIPMEAAGDLHSADIPEQFFSDTISYSVEARDRAENTAHDPENAPEDDYSFTLLLPPLNLDAGDDYEDYVPLSWDPPGSNIEEITIAYDDGGAENGYYWLGAGAGWAVKFTPPYYPVMVKECEIYITNVSSEVEFHGWNADGAFESPGTDIFEAFNTDLILGIWNEIDLTDKNLVIHEGDFYLGYIQTEAGGPALGFDQTSVQGRSWGYNNVDWEALEYMDEAILGNLMIRAVVEPYNPDLEGDPPSRIVLEGSSSVDSPVQRGNGPVRTAVQVDLAEGMSPVDITDISTVWGAPGRIELEKYRIYRSLTPGENYTVIDSVDAPVTEYQDDNVEGGTTYYYVVTAVYPDGESGYSNEAEGTPYSDVAVHTSGFTGTYERGTIRLNWQFDGHPSLTSFTVRRSTVFDDKGEEIARVAADKKGTCGYVDTPPDAVPYLYYSLWETYEDGSKKEAGNITLSMDRIVPSSTALRGISPNPFNPSTTIYFDISSRNIDHNGDASVSIKIFDTSGHMLRKLMDGKCAPGRYALLWNGKDDRGLSVPSGIYFIRLQVDNHVETRKSVLLK